MGLLSLQADVSASWSYWKYPEIDDRLRLNPWAEDTQIEGVGYDVCQKKRQKKIITSRLEWQNNGICWEKKKHTSAAQQLFLVRVAIISVQNQYSFSDANASKSAPLKRQALN